MIKLLTAALLCCTIVRAQDFGYEYSLMSEYRSIGMSYNAQSFDKQSSNPLVDSTSISFSSRLPFVEFRQDNGRLAVGFQTYTDRNGNKRESFSVYGETANDFPLTKKGKEKPTLLIPLIVSVNYVRAEPPSVAAKNFDIGSFGIGSGMKFRYFDRSIGVQALAVGSIYYASEGFGTDYGSQTSFAAEVQIIVPGIVLEGIVIGYRAETQQWNMNNNTLDYGRTYHGAFAGILF